MVQGESANFRCDEPRRQTPYRRLRVKSSRSYMYVLSEKFPVVYGTCGASKGKLKTVDWENPNEVKACILLGPGRSRFDPSQSASEGNVFQGVRPFERNRFSALTPFSFACSLRAFILGVLSRSALISGLKIWASDSGVQAAKDVEDGNMQVLQFFFCSTIQENEMDVGKWCTYE